MDVLTGGTYLVQALLFVAGLVAGILLRGRDGLAALLLAVGFGVQIIGVALSIAEPFLLDSAGIGAADLVYGFSLVLRVVDLAAFVLIFVGLLRLVRRRPVASRGAVR